VVKKPFLKSSLGKQFGISAALVIAVSLLCYFLSGYMEYRTVALILLVAVSLAAMLFDILPVMLAALLSALIWDFFFIPPHYNLLIESTEDLLMFLMYFVIATVSAVLTYKIRQVEKRALREEERERTLQLYNTILNSLSHELRTPISTIIGASDNLQQESKLSEKNKSDLLAEIAAAAFRLDRQVENLLNMSRLESGFLKPRKDWTDISELIYGVVQRVERTQVSQKILVHVQENMPLFKLDKVMIEETLYNLLRNAVLYTPSNGIISIGAHKKQGHLELRMEDTGPGFPENEIDKVFDKFYRLKNSQAGGTGLGLSIAKGFVEVHNGTIELDNMPQGGARFTISIPAEDSAITSTK
jgi:two-component system sensor histidine kinase KdpD